MTVESDDEQEVIDLTFGIATGSHLTLAGLAVVAVALLPLAGSTGVALAVSFGIFVVPWAALAVYSRFAPPDARLTVRADRITIDKRKPLLSIGVGITFRSITELGTDEGIELTTRASRVWSGDLIDEKVDLYHARAVESGLTVVGYMNETDAGLVARLLNESLQRLRSAD
ncbi:MAG: hypothetical protein AAF962_08610 [Actinomycetota bacterium]